MRLSDKGLLEIAEHEGIVPAPYKDSVGVWTYGIGHTAAAGHPDPQEMNGAMPSGAALTQAIDRAIELFREDVTYYEARVNGAITASLKQHEFDALVSFDFNTGGIYRAKLRHAINRGDPDASRHFLGWLKPPEIRKRRMSEKHLFETGDYDANGDSIPIWETNSRGKLIGVMRIMSGQELFERMRKSQPVPATNNPLAALLRALLSIFQRKQT